MKRHDGNTNDRSPEQHLAAGHGGRLAMFEENQILVHGMGKMIGLNIGVLATAFTPLDILP